MVLVHEIKSDLIKSKQNKLWIFAPKSAKSRSEGINSWYYGYYDLGCSLKSRSKNTSTFHPFSYIHRWSKSTSKVWSLWHQWPTRRAQQRQIVVFTKYAIVVKVMQISPYVEISHVLIMFFRFFFNSLTILAHPIRDTNQVDFWPFWPPNSKWQWWLVDFHTI